MKQETEMALRLLEKDIHEKQDSVIALRKQLDDIKAINLQLFEKLQVKLNFLKLVIILHYGACLNYTIKMLCDIGNAHCLGTKRPLIKIPMLFEESLQ
jgi:hypothetical protein